MNAVCDSVCIVSRALCRIVIASHTCFGGHMDVNCYARLQTFKCV